ncbi:MAG TPA: penicillin-binding transpeptidase domain-containing protein [Cellulomonas sp.]
MLRTPRTPPRTRPGTLDPFPSPGTRRSAPGPGDRPGDARRPGPAAPSVAALPARGLVTLVCALVAGVVFAACTTDPGSRAAGATVLAATSAVVTWSRHRWVGALTGLSWSVVAIGAAAQIRLDPSQAGRTLAVVLAAAGGLAVARAVARRLLSRGWHGRVPQDVAGVALLAAALAARLAPATSGRLASGTLPVPVVGSVQVGELTRPVVVLGAALLADALLEQALLGGWDRRGRLLAGTGAALGGTYLAVLLVLDSGPALLTLVALTTVAAGLAPRARLALGRAWRLGGVRARGAAVLRAAVLLAGVVLVSGWVLRRLGTVDRWVARLASVDSPAEQIAAALTAARRGGLVGAGLGSQPLVEHVPVAGTDMLVAVLAAEIGLGVVAVLVALVLVLLGVLLREVVRERGPVPAAAAGLLVALVVQLVVAVLGPLGLVPMTGVSAPLLVVGGSSLIPVALVLGLAQGLVGAAPAPGGPPGVPLVLRGVVAAVTTGCLLVALLPASGGSQWSALMLPRGALLTRDGQTIAEATADGTDRRAYPQGALYADVGALVPGYRATGAESTFGTALTCGAGRSVLDRLGEVLHPAVCRPADVVTTLDSGVQQAVAAALGVQHGSAVVLDALTGEVLAMYSTDQTSPEDLAAGDQPTAPSRLDALTPGSVLKPMAAVVAAQHGLGTDAAPADVLTVGGERLRNMGGATCPDTTLVGALTYSCNTVLGYLGASLGADRLSAGLAETFGAGAAVPFDGGDVVGLSTGLTDGSTAAQAARTAIGQEGARTSVLAVAAMTGAIARAATGATGAAPAPHLLALVCSEGQVQQAADPVAWGSSIDPDVAAEVLRGMAGATERGTLTELGDAAAAAGREVAGKSGTADVATDQSGSGILRWATVVVDGRWVVTVVVRDQQAGADNAAAQTVADVLTDLPRTDAVSAVC